METGVARLASGSLAGGALSKATGKTGAGLFAATGLYQVPRNVTTETPGPTMDAARGVGSSVVGIALLVAASPSVAMACARDPRPAMMVIG